MRKDLKTHLRTEDLIGIRNRSNEKPIAVIIYKNSKADGYPLLFGQIAEMKYAKGSQSDQVYLFNINDTPRAKLSLEPYLEAPDGFTALIYYKGCIRTTLEVKELREAIRAFENLTRQPEEITVKAVRVPAMTYSRKNLN